VRSALFRRVLLAPLALASCLAATNAASATTPRLGKPAGIRVAATTPSSFTVTVRPAARAKRYFVLASADEDDLTDAALGRASATRVQQAASHPTITVSGLGYTAAPYFYRVETRNGSQTETSQIHQTHLQPAVPSDLAAITTRIGSHGLALTWGGGDAARFTVEQATDSSMHTDLRRYTLDGDATQFTPYGLATGTTYYFRVRASNGTARSSYSPVVSANFTGAEQPLRVMTYNVLHMQFDGTKENGTTIAPWSQRLPKAVALIKSAKPDVISIQEADDWFSHDPKKLQIDPLASALSSDYTLFSCDGSGLRYPYRYRTGNYLLYRTAEFSRVGYGRKIRMSTKHTSVSTMYWACATTLQNVTSGAQFTVVATHLIHGKDVKDARRTREMDRMIAGAHLYQHHLPIIYAGDFNSFSAPGSPLLDTPEQHMRANFLSDALVAAQTRSNTQYASMNGYRRVPSQTGRIIDHIAADPGVATTGWSQLLNLHDGHFVGVIPSDHNPVVADLVVQY
jgi:endonuclease/exonuclease/phosphatase family metal-dependent hydrolase